MGGQDPEGIQFPPRKLPTDGYGYLGDPFQFGGWLTRPAYDRAQVVLQGKGLSLHQVFRERAPKASQDFLAFQLHAIRSNGAFLPPGKPSALLLRANVFPTFPGCKLRGLGIPIGFSLLHLLGDKISLVSGFLTKLLPVQLVGGVIVFGSPGDGTLLRDLQVLAKKGLGLAIILFFGFLGFLKLLQFAF